MAKTGRLLAIAFFAAALATSAAGESPLVGRWLLVEQTYGSGQSSLLPVTEPLRLEFFRDGPRLSGRVWFGSAKAQAVPWPSLGLVPVDADEPIVSPAEDRVSVRYRARQAAGDETVLEITEEYRVTSGGAALSGTVTVAVLRGSGPGGSYVLKRRLRREP